MAIQSSELSCEENIEESSTLCLESPRMLKAEVNGPLLWEHERRLPLEKCTRDLTHEDSGRSKNDQELG